MASTGRFGPFHRRCEPRPEEIAQIGASGQLWGRPRRNFFAGLVPAVKAWDGPLPADAIGVEFYTEVAPDPWSISGWPEWTEGQPGVIVLEDGELVAIPVVATMTRDVERSTCEPRNQTSCRATRTRCWPRPSRKRSSRGGFRCRSNTSPIHRTPRSLRRLLL